jgi:hypothetical protein
MTARQILDDAEKDIPQKFADQPELREKLLKQIGTVYDKMTATAPLAMILEVRSTVQLQSARDPKQQAVPQTLLYSGDRLKLAADAQVQLVVLSDLHKERLKPGKEATIRRKGCEPADAVSDRIDDMLMTFVPLPKGTFYMGGGGGKAGKKTEIKEDFEIAVHTVTQGQWQELMGKKPSHFSRAGEGKDKVKDIKDEDLKHFPVEMVSWNDAQEFIKKLNDKEKRGKGRATSRKRKAAIEVLDVHNEMDEQDDNFHLSGPDSLRILAPSATFNSFVLWNADIPVNEGRDEYMRCLTEWTQLAAVVRVCFLAFLVCLDANSAISDTSCRRLNKGERLCRLW